MKYILFKKVWRQHTEDAFNQQWVRLLNAQPKEDNWKEGDNRCNDTSTKEILEFVCEAPSPQAVAAAIRKDPLAKYVLFHGTVADAHVAMPVFVNGKNLDTLTSEWADVKIED